MLDNAATTPKDTLTMTEPAHRTCWQWRIKNDGRGANDLRRPPNNILWLAPTGIYLSLHNCILKLIIVCTIYRYRTTRHTIVGQRGHFRHRRTTSASAHRTTLHQFTRHVDKWRTQRWTYKDQVWPTFVRVKNNRFISFKILHLLFFLRLD